MGIRAREKKAKQNRDTHQRQKLSTQPSKKYPAAEPEANTARIRIRSHSGPRQYPTGAEQRTDQGQGGKDNAHLKPVKATFLTKIQDRSRGKRLRGLP